MLLMAFRRYVASSVLLFVTACNCDGELERIPEPSASLAFETQSAPPLDYLDIALEPSLVNEARSAEFKILNSGDAALEVTEILLVSHPELCPRRSSAFQISQPNENSSGMRTIRIDGSSEASVTIVFTPEDGTPVCTVVEVHSTDRENPLLFARLSGQGDAPQLCAQPGTLNFGEVYIGDTVEETIVLESCGTRPIQILEYVPNDQFPPFGLNGSDLPLELAAGDQLNLPVSFSPTSEAVHSLALGNAGLITIETDLNDQFYQLALEGSGRKQPSCELNASPNVLNFGSIAEGRDSTQTVILRNLGELECTISGVEVREPAGSFSSSLIGFTIGETIAPNDFISIDVTFAPTIAQGAENSFLDISSDDPLAPTISVPLEGTSIPLAPCLLEANPAGVNFGNQPVEMTAERTVTLTNIGTETCTVQSVELSSGAPSFGVIASVFPIIGTPVPVGGSLSTLVTYRPEDETLHTGELRIQYKEQGFGNPSTELLIPLDGQGLAPSICVTPTEVDFGEIALGDSVDAQIEISNCGATLLEFRGVSLQAGSHPDFTIFSSPTLPINMDPGTTSTVTVRANVTEAGVSLAGEAMFGVLNIVSSDPDYDVFPVGLRANATDCSTGLVCFPLTLNFGDVMVGDQLIRHFSCTNVGLQTATINPSTSSPFELIHGPTSLAAQETGVFSVAFTPSVAGPEEGFVWVGADDCTGQEISIALSGQGNETFVPDCPTPDTFSPQSVWSWNGGNTLPNSSQVWMTPLISRLEDTDGDALLTLSDSPRVIFTSFDHADVPSITDTDGVNDPVPGVLRAVDGATGEDVFTVTNEEYWLNSSANLALGDIDADGYVEIVAQKYVLLPGVETIPNGPKIAGKFLRGRLIAFEHDGSFKWISDEWTRKTEEIEDLGGPAIADMDGDGFGEIALGDHVFNHHGQLLWRGGQGTGSTGHGPMSVMINIDGEPDLELVTGSTAYRADGSILWSREDLLTADAFDGHPAVADLDGDGTQEVVVRGPNLYVLDGPTGATIAGPKLPPVNLSQGDTCEVGTDEEDCNPIPTNVAIMDIDGDGTLEIAVSNEAVLLVYDRLLNEIWRTAISDFTGASGPIAFDFDGDGAENIVYGDETSLWVFGETGDEIYSADRTSITMMETASVGDVNLDGHANLAIASNDTLLGSVDGLEVLTNTGVSWAHARAMWNQHAYVEMLIGELGSLLYWPLGTQSQEGFRSASARCQ